MTRTESPWLDAITTASAPANPTKRDAASSAPARARAALDRDESDPATRALFARLVAWRRTLARASAVPAYVIFPDRTLDAVASARPTTRAELATLPGVGPVKLDRYGDAVLALVAGG
jgi:superfamily II DNA helicase RecQ